MPIFQASRRPTPAHSARTAPALCRRAMGACVVSLLGIAVAPQSGWASRIRPPPPPGPEASDANPQFGVQQSQFDLGSTFLERAGDQMSWGTNAARANNPGGGGASQETAPQLYRSWAELYGINSRTDAQGTFTGDQRRTYGGVGGFGATVLPGFNVGVTVDVSNSKIDMPESMQSADLGLTQVGVNASYTIGAWTLAAVIVHGWGNIASERDTLLGPTLANYHGRIDGALGEVSYYWSTGQSRIVPKLGFEYVRAVTDSFSEVGGFNPVTAAAVTGDRAKVLAGTELGHYFVVDGHVLDLSGYGKFVDNVMQNLDPLAITAHGHSIAIQGVVESQYGADAGAGLSYGLSQALRVYANYDGKFRQNFVSHQGTVGLEVRW